MKRRSEPARRVVPVRLSAAELDQVERIVRQLDRWFPLSAPHTRTDAVRHALRHAARKAGA